ncbi:Microtubule-associated protein 4 [Liparis tanakae]|uniref:Microtubule-associated protein 4 n=1 Tax=Liparis tanakae TaxID=230148 RepID=A0A4Z2GFB9_9TELE|nr:Microtubule-associated protein 4 [Liparis tanakae]
MSIVQSDSSAAVKRHTCVVKRQEKENIVLPVATIQTGRRQTRTVPQILRLFPEAGRDKSTHGLRGRVEESHLSKQQTNAGPQSHGAVYLTDRRLWLCSAHPRSTVPTAPSWGQIADWLQLLADCNRTMDLSLRDALGGGGVPGGAPAEALLKRDFVASLEKESYDDQVGETVSKSDYRPLLDGKDGKSEPLSADGSSDRVDVFV